MSDNGKGGVTTLTTNSFPNGAHSFGSTRNFFSRRRKVRKIERDDDEDYIHLKEAEGFLNLLKQTDREKYEKFVRYCKETKERGSKIHLSTFVGDIGPMLKGSSNPEVFQKFRNFIPLEHIEEVETITEVLSRDHGIKVCPEYVKAFKFLRLITPAMGQRTGEFLRALEEYQHGNERVKSKCMETFKEILGHSDTFFNEFLKFLPKPTQLKMRQNPKKKKKRRKVSNEPVSSRQLRAQRRRVLREKVKVSPTNNRVNSGNVNTTEDYPGPLTRVVEPNLRHMKMVPIGNVSIVPSQPPLGGKELFTRMDVTISNVMSLQRKLKKFLRVPKKFDFSLLTENQKNTIRSMYIPHARDDNMEKVNQVLETLENEPEKGLPLVFRRLEQFHNMLVGDRERILEGSKKSKVLLVPSSPPLTRSRRTSSVVAPWRKKLPVAVKPLPKPRRSKPVPKPIVKPKPKSKRKSKPRPKVKGQAISKPIPVVHMENDTSMLDPDEHYRFEDGTLSRSLPPVLHESMRDLNLHKEIWKWVSLYSKLPDLGTPKVLWQKLVLPFFGIVIVGETSKFVESMVLKNWFFGNMNFAMFFCLYQMMYNSLNEVRKGCKELDKHRREAHLPKFEDLVKQRFSKEPLLKINFERMLRTSFGVALSEEMMGLVEDVFGEFVKSIKIICDDVADSPKFVGMFIHHSQNRTREDDYFREADNYLSDHAAEIYRIQCDLKVRTLSMKIMSRMRRSRRKNTNKK